MDNSELEIKLRALLDDVARKLSFQKFVVDLDLSAQKGDGFLGLLYKCSITDQASKEKIHLVVKKAPMNEIRREETCIKMAFEKEIYFYATIVPLFEKLQQEHQVTQIFNKIPRYFVSCEETMNEMIVLEDVTKLGYQMRDKNLVLDDEHAKFIFEVYGRFHALSFCLKDQTLELYNKVKGFLSSNVLQEFGKKQGFPHALQKMTEKSYETLDLAEDSDICEKFKKYADNALKIYNSLVNYQGEYPVILHGDCWSNNMMFKYKNAKLADMKLIDFQLTALGSPVFDLSYFFYSGGCESLFKNLEKYLDIYYNSLAKCTKEFGSNIEKLFTRHALSEEWKTYSKFGMLMALLLFPVKLMSKEDAIEMSESLGIQNEKSKSKFENAQINTSLLQLRTRELLNHMYEIDAL